MHFRLGALVTLAAVVVRPVQAQLAPLMTVLLRPGVMSEATGTGNLDVTMTIPAMQVAARTPLLTLPLFVPGLARSQQVLTIRVRDDRGQVPLNSVGDAGTGRWNPWSVNSPAASVAKRLRSAATMRCETSVSPPWASPHSRAARLVTPPMAA